MQAALGLCQLEVLDEILEKRRRLAERYTAAIELLPGMEPPYDPPYSVRTWQSYCVRVSRASPIGRTELMCRLLTDGIPTRRGVMASHHELAYATSAGGALEHTDAAADDVLMLPLFPDMTDEQQDYVISRLARHVVVRAA